MSIFTPAEFRLAEAVARLGYCNPFLPERIQCERAALGSEFDERYAQWNLQPELPLSPNVERLVQRWEAMSDAVRGRLADESRLAGHQAQLYDDMLMFILFQRFRDRIPGAEAARQSAGSTRQWAAIYEQLLASARSQLTFGNSQRTMSAEFPHLFAVFFQLRRAFDNISRSIIGVSQPAVALLAAVWQSIFTHDMRRYGRVLFHRMADHTTLVMGPSGTGKELVARAVGLSRYIPFDAKTRTFQADFVQSFFPISLSAMSPTLIESELFGHKRGSFTGAAGDRVGWLEVCPPHGSVFLDEIGELEPAIQVKLLRVLQARAFSRLGETDLRQFHGKIVAATNCNLDQEMCEGRFRNVLIRKEYAQPPGCAGESRGGSQPRVVRGPDDRGPAGSLVLHAELCADGQLRSHGPPAATRPPYGKGQDRPRSAPPAVACSTESNDTHRSDGSAAFSMTRCRNPQRVAQLLAADETPYD